MKNQNAFDYFTIELEAYAENRYENESKEAIENN